MRLTPTLATALIIACGSPRAEPPKPPITVFAAASLARSLQVLTDTFTRRTHVPVQSELGGSIEHARKMTELGRTPDVLMLVDEDVIAGLMPTHIDWYVRFATNQIVIAYTSRSKAANTIDGENWWRTLLRPGVTIGRADPDIAPAGRHALTLLRRADTYYHQHGLGDRLLEHAKLRYVRPNATELAALLETGEVDYILDYESVARQYGFKFISLPEDLADPVLYGISVPRRAAHFAEGVQFAAFVVSEDGKQILREANVNVLNVPVAMGSAVPPEISEHVRTVAVASASR